MKKFYFNTTRFVEASKEEKAERKLVQKASKLNWKDWYKNVVNRLLWKKESYVGIVSQLWKFIDYVAT